MFKHILPFVLSVTLLSAGVAQNIESENFYTLDAKSKAEATEVTLSGELNISKNGDFRQLRDIAWQLKSLDLAKASCSEIPDNAMHSRHKLKHISLPKDVEKIGSQSFFACDNIGGKLTFPATITTIGESAFAQCKKLNGICFEGDNLKTIGRYAFAGCIGLSGTITLPHGLESIEDGAFYGCNNIKKIVIPVSVKKIGAAAFAGCRKLKVEFESHNGAEIYTDAFSGTKSYIPASKHNRQEISIIPMPNQMEVSDHIMILGKKVRIESDAALDNEKEHLLNILKNRTSCKVSSSANTTIKLRLTDGLAEEQYVLNIENNTIDISASTPAGVFYGLMTLEQLMTSDNIICEAVPCLSINDTPRTEVRELMIDPARHFIPFEDIKAMIPEMARYKMNSLHLHLSDDQAWRLEIKAYPLLTEKASSRVGMDDMPELIEGSYSQKEMRELVEYAAKYHVMIIPELEMPGHSVAAIHCYPWLTCEEKEVSIRTTCGVSNELLCPSNEKVYEFLCTVIGEMCDIFTAPYFHIGGDEAGNPALGCWSGCERCTAFKQEHNLTENWQLQEYMFNRIIDTLQAHGKTPMFWYETDFKHIKSGCVTFAWRNGLTQKAIDAARENNARIMLCPGEHCYLDYPDGAGNMPEVNWGMPATTLEQVYKLDPAWGNDETFVSENLFGVAGTLWSECINSTERIYYMAYPRALALAEAGWSEMDVRSWDNFQKRLNTILTDMSRRGIPFSRTK